MKNLLCLSLLFLCSLFSKAQDIISLKTGETIKAKVKEIGTSTVKYRIFKNLDGPDHLIEKANVSEITYENGQKETFPEATLIDVSSIIVKNPSSTNSTIQPFVNDTKNTELYTYEKGISDAMIYYRGQNSGKTGTLITSLLVNGLIGLFVAVPCSLTEPKMKNLGIPSNNVYINNPAYAKGYTNQAKKIKSKKIWTNWGIGTAISTVILVIASSRK